MSRVAKPNARPVKRGHQSAGEQAPATNPEVANENAAADESPVSSIHPGPGRGHPLQWLRRAQESGETKSSFVSPGAAAEEFAEAVRTGDKGRARSRCSDRNPRRLLNPGDTVQGGNERKAFLQAYDSVPLLVPAGPDAFFLEVGAGRWPLPLPIVKQGNGWMFDTRTGIRELVLRRIGRNELAVLGVLQRPRRRRNTSTPRGSGHLPASCAASRAIRMDSIGKRNAGEPESPAGPLLAWAEAQGYTPGGATGDKAPYRGYFLSRPECRPISRKNSPSWPIPAEYGASGIMTFIVNQDGAIYRKNLGVDTEKSVQEIQAVRARRHLDARVLMGPTSNS